MFFPLHYCFFIDNILSNLSKYCRIIHTIAYGVGFMGNKGLIWFHAIKLLPKLSKVQTEINKLHPE